MSLWKSLQIDTSYQNWIHIRITLDDPCIAADVGANRHRAELARQGSLADRHLPASLVARRQNSVPSDPAGSGGSGCVSVESEGEAAEADTDDDHEQTAVRFKVEAEEDAGGDDKMRLHRRDTPHHLKNKRINQQVMY